MHPSKRAFSFANYTKSSLSTAKLTILFSNDNEVVYVKLPVMKVAHMYLNEWVETVALKLQTYFDLANSPPNLLMRPAMMSGFRVL